MGCLHSCCERDEWEHGGSIESEPKDENDHVEAITTDMVSLFDISIPRQGHIMATLAWFALTISLLSFQVWFDIKIGDEMAGRIEIGVFGKTVPITAKNFVELAKMTEIGEGYKGNY